ncbi:sigma-70 family RNA polymerase sigma factor [Candidatus Phytoplasma prunorum]|uniref:sigma-70 family RNA polymerase sigma factor n=1 Tax=Candidatus Phytoplasma prunorum TaxID=47565 RepID=UPI002FF3F473
MNRNELLKNFLKDKNNLALRNQIIIIHLPLVKKIVQNFKYYPRCLTRADLYQEAILGLIKTLTNYKDYGYDLIAFAKPHIRKTINELIRKINKINDLQSFSENHYPATNFNPHQLWVRQNNHQNFSLKIKSKLSQKEFKIIKLSFGIPHKNIHQNLDNAYSNSQIAKKLNLTSKQVETFKNIAIRKLKNLYKSGYFKKYHFQYLNN